MSTLPLLCCIIIVAGVTGRPNYDPSDYSVCQTAACRQLAQAIQSNMNNSIDPCTDFYEYGCGSWATNNPIPPNRLEWSMDDEIDTKTNLRMKDVLEQESEYDKIPPIKKAKQYYRSCLDEDAIEKQGLKPMQTLLNLTGGWPILMPREEWEMENYTWQEVDDVYTQLLSLSCFFKIVATRDEQNSTRNILMINQDLDYPLRGKVSKKGEHKKSDSNTYITSMVKVIRAFAKDKGVELPIEKLRKDLIELLVFEVTLQNITENEKQNRELEKNYTRMTIAELQDYYDLAGTQQSTAKINWLRTIQLIFEPVNVIIDASEPVIVYDKHLLHQLAHLLNATPPNVLVNYVQWNIVMDLMDYLNKEMRDLDFEMRYLDYNVTEQEPRWKTCIKDIPMKDAVSFLFVKKYTSTNTLQTVAEMVEDLKAEMKSRVLHSMWTKDSTKDFMIDKVNNIISQIGYPPWYDNQTALIKLYEGLEIGDNYFENMLVYLQYDTKKDLMSFREPTDRNEWLDYPVSVNAFYAPSTNAMFISAAEIQDPFFTSGIPLAINYAVVGSTVGHELAHSFDSSGIQFDKFGNKRSWHTNETNQAYEERAQCFVDQYNNFTMDVTDVDGDPIQVDGEITKDENIADSIGIQIAFAAFQKRKMMAGPQPRLPGLTNISDEQLFFLSYVNAWCSTTRRTFEADFANSDSHSPPKFRIIGSLSNTRSFSKTFNCPPNSPMNPNSKCSLWK